ncbi:MAG: MFS transporter [Mogibacterium sp.]|nr:MFS transporter [Mogibacterium sp.]
MSDQNTTASALWTRDFTIITAGSIISMFGNSMSGFAMSLMVLDISKSTLLYAIYISMYTIPQLIMPLFSGAILDRYSRKRMIYTLDFISAGLYMLMAGVLATGWFSFPLFAAYCFVLGTIESSYMVAYESFYPLLISEGNYQKAYSIASLLETTSAVMVPVSTFLYRQIGLAPLLAANGICFFIAAVMETQIRTEEEYIETQKATRLEGASHARQVLEDTREGFRYLFTEKGLLAVALYFGILAVTGGISSVITLPYFKNTFSNGEYIYMLVWGCALAGRAIGGGIHYKTVIPVDKRYIVALLVYIANALGEAFYLFFHVPVMMVICFLIGLGGVTSYTIRISATQSYVPDEMKGRFNGAFNTIYMIGAVVGEMTAGFGSQVINERTLLMISMIISAVSALLIIGGAREHVEKVYNRIN